MYWLILAVILFLPCLQASALEEFPVLYEGRYRPAEAYLKQLQIHEEEGQYEGRLIELKKEGLKPNEIGEILEQEFPVLQRIRTSGRHFLALPNRLGEWVPLHALTLKVYSPIQDALQPIGNFTPYSQQQFESIRQAYLNAQEALYTPESLEPLAASLQQGYLTIAGKEVQKAHGKTLTYPSILQLKIETLYVKFPWIILLIVLYSLALFLFVASLRVSGLKIASLSAMGAALLLHTVILAMRCYILERPPVSNMFETVIYVPWVAGCACLCFPFARRQPVALIAACVTSILLLLLIQLTGLNQSLDNVQAVLDSQFWLMVHVLLVVGSYGIFILGALLGHIYLFLVLKKRKENEEIMSTLNTLILQSLYGGTALLISGTILGGIWAAESWGRFWDWDPKESWAFISSCFYLIWIHAYRFGKIGPFGLAIGAVSGLLAISFTWYGVNYILGTGLHSYGFGNGGEAYYYTFVTSECLFIATVIFMNWHRNKELYKITK